MSLLICFHFLLGGICGLTIYHLHQRKKKKQTRKIFHQTMEYLATHQVVTAEVIEEINAAGLKILGNI